MPQKKGYTKTNLKVYKPKSGKSSKTTPSKAAIAKIAKAAVKSVAEKKFMDVNNELRQINPTRPAGNDYISAVGFSTTIGDDNNGNPILYGGQALQEMMCLRPFRRDDTSNPTDLRAMAPDGKHITPVSCKSRIRLTRHYGDMPAQATAQGNDPDFPLGLARNLPVRCRMIRCTPAIAAGTATELDPDGDLFQDEYGRKTGVSEASFGPEELMFYRVNTRRWRVLEDKQFDIRNPLTVNWNLSVNTGGTHVYSPSITNTNLNCEKYLNINHQLSQRRGGKCYYSDPMASDTKNANTGNRREYLFFQFCWKGGEYITGTTPEGGVTREKGPIDLDIDLVNYTKFVDV